MSSLSLFPSLLTSLASAGPVLRGRRKGDSRGLGEPRGGDPMRAAGRRSDVRGLGLSTRESTSRLCALAAAEARATARGSSLIAGA